MFDRRVKQGDGLSPVLIIIALHYVIKDEAWILNKTSQMRAYADVL